MNLPPRDDYFRHVAEQGAEYDIRVRHREFGEQPEFVPPPLTLSPPPAVSSPDQQATKDAAKSRPVGLGAGSFIRAVRQ